MLILRSILFKRVSHSRFAIVSKAPSMKRVLSSGVLLVLCTLLIEGCAHQAYVGETLSSNEIAIVEDSYWGSFRFDRAMIIGVDHDDFGAFGRERVKLLPGKHKIYIMCYHGWNMATAGLYGRHEVIEFDAEANHEYRAYCSIIDDDQWSWIEELESASIAGGKKP